VVGGDQPGASRVRRLLDLLARANADPTGVRAAAAVIMASAAVVRPSAIIPAGRGGTDDVLCRGGG